MSQTTHPLVNRATTAPHLRGPVIVQSPPATASTAASRRRSARAAVVWGVASVALANLGLAAAVEAALPKLRDPEYGYRIAHLRALQRAHPDRPLVLMVGTSRTQNAVNPAAMGFPDGPGSPLVFNFGQSGAIPVRQLLNLQRLLDEGVRPAAVVVEVFPATLGVPGPADPYLVHHATRFTAADLRRLGPYLTDYSLHREWAGKRLNSWGAQQPVLLSHLAPRWQPWRMRIDHQWAMLDERGFNAYPAADADERRPERLARIRSEYAPIVRDIRVSELSRRAYRDAVAECRSRGIAVAFALTPESPAFRDWYSAESRRAVADYLREIADELGCPVFPAPGDYAEGDFADGHHMLAPTASRFSQELADHHLKPWLAQCRFQW